jgi:KDO2-lipid IV(A) lauroyltransferase
VKAVYLIWIGFLYLVSLLPLWVLHRFSEVTYFFVYYLGGYRKSVVRENLLRAFPNHSDEQRMTIEKKFYAHFCDLIFETLKSFTLSKKSLQARCVYLTPEISDQLFAQGHDLMGVSSHLANWEWKGMALGYEFKQSTYVVYKPLSTAYLNQLVVRSRERFGSKLVAIKNLRSIFDEPHRSPIAIGLLSDQAPHDYSKAFEVDFFGRKTWVAAGAGVLTVQKNMQPVWGWMRRTGRSRYEWGLEVLKPEPPVGGWTASDLQQVERISLAHGLTLDQAKYALSLTQLFTQKLEERIKMAPQDWLWSHRRWKQR